MKNFLQRLRTPVYDEALDFDVPDTAFAVEQEPPQTIVQRYASNLSTVIAAEREREAHFVRELETVSEQLRQTRLVLAQLEPAAKAIAEDAGT